MKSHKKHRRQRTQKKFWYGMLLLCFVIAVGIWMSTFKVFRKAPDPPTVSLGDLDHLIVNIIEQAQNDLRAAPKAGSAWGKLGLIYMVYDFKAESQFCLAQAEALDPKEPRWAYFHGLSLFPNEVEKGISKLETAVRLFGNESQSPRLRLATILSEQGRLKEAEAQFRHVLQQTPDSAQAHLGMGKLAFANGNLNESIQHLNKCSKNYYSRKTALRLLSTIYLRLGDKAAAETATDTAETLPDDLAWPDPYVDEASQFRTGRVAWIDHAQRLVREGRFGEAIPILRRTVSVYPDAAEAWISLGKIGLAQKDFAAAEEALRNAISTSPDSVEALAQLGVALLHQKQNQEAADYFRRAIHLKADLAEAHFNLGLCLGMLGQNDAAMQSFRDAILYKPNLPDAHIGLANLLAATGRQAEAASHLEQALQIAPNDSRAQRLLDKIQAQR